ncbi:MAG: carboxylating nicotinate-nucleotide diphosphorylase [Bryobacteraceae bacterium]
MIDHPDILALVKLALEEDIGAGDATTLACIAADRIAVGRYYARQDAVLAGIGLLELIYEMRGGVKHLHLPVMDGARVCDGQLVGEVRGAARTLLECERVSLNFLQRLSGIATLAQRYTDAVEGTGCKVLDTRKTTPGLRRLEKMAAAAGGVQNHRMGLYDAVLIKNNHITAAGGVRAALERVSQSPLLVEIEVRTMAELEEALACGAKHLLLDNLTPARAAEWIRYIDGRATAELSGNITLDTVRSYAETGADYVSSGAITHSAMSADFNFRLELIS